MLGDFVQRIPRDGEPASLRTEVRIGHDDGALYVGVRAFDDQPSLIVPGEAIRDNDLSQSDAILLIFDTYNDDVNGFLFGTNPAGIEANSTAATAVAAMQTGTGRPARHTIRDSR